MRNADRKSFFSWFCSTDNLLSIDYVARPKCTDSLVREVNFALRYFEDAVVKGTYEMLPGCATVVLETVVNLQNYTVTKVSAIASRYQKSEPLENFGPFGNSINSSTY